MIKPSCVKSTGVSFRPVRCSLLCNGLINRFDMLTSPNLWNALNESEAFVMGAFFFFDLELSLEGLKKSFNNSALRSFWQAGAD